MPVEGLTPREAVDVIQSVGRQRLLNSTWPWSGGALDIGLRRPLHVREERLAARRDACRLLYVSDIHLRPGRSATLCRHILDAVAGCSPDVVLLGGDLVDCASELPRLGELVGILRQAAPVLAIAGNHDQRLGLHRVRDAVEEGGGQWIHDGTARVTHGDRVIAVSGPGVPGPADGHVRVLCAHHPRIWRTMRDAGYDLILAGHLHGCQVVACAYRGRLFPGAMLYPYCCLSRQRAATRLVVSRGVSDLVPIRWKCPREVVLCYV